MPKYYEFMICGYFLYFTSHSIVEAMHVHASDKKLTESGSAKFFVKSNGDLLYNLLVRLMTGNCARFVSLSRKTTWICTLLGRR